ncbi:deoxycytidylate deaminase isoform X2 [Xylocopa sonorina]
MTTEEPTSKMSCECSSVSKSGKRENYMDWKEYFMALAFLSAQRSKDPKTQVGACIVNEEKKIVGIGYNGMPTGCSDDEFPWTKDSTDLLNRKSLYVCHAELNAVLNSNSRSIKNSTIFVTLFPCNECAKVIIQSGIKSVIYASDKHAKKDKTKAAKIMFNAAGVEYSQYFPKNEQLILNLSVIDNEEDD